jgi:hypothetical protein
MRKSLRMAAISDPSFQPSFCASGRAVVVEADNAKKLFDLHLTWQAKGRYWTGDQTIHTSFLPHHFGPTGI